MVAIIPALVPRPVVPSATAWYASSNQLGVIVARSSAGCSRSRSGDGVRPGRGVLMSRRDFIFLIHMERVPRASEPMSLAVAARRLRVLWRDRVILGTISLDMCAVFLAGVPALFPVFARDILATGPWGLGLLRAAPGVGAFAMSVVLARRPLTLPIGKVLFAVMGIFGVAIIVFALSTHHRPVARRAGGDGRRRRGERGDPLRAGAVAHAAGDARPRQRGQRHVHRHLELSR